MAKQAPGKHYRNGLSLVQAVQQYSDEQTVEKMFIESRWPDGIACPYCGSVNIKTRPTRKPAPFRCYDCRKDFSVKTGTVMHSSNLPLSKWALGAYIVSTSLKGVSSMKLHRDLGITQKSAWHLAHRLRKALETEDGLFSGPVEVDETYIGGKEANKHESKRRHAGRGPVGKTAVVGMRDRNTGKVASSVVAVTDAPTLKGFIAAHAEPNAEVYTDEAKAYQGLPNHKAVRHSGGEYAVGDVHTNSIESHWAMMKRGIVGTYHHISPKHTNRYAAEFAGRHNARRLDTVDQIRKLIRGMSGKQLRYSDLTAEPV